MTIQSIYELFVLDGADFVIAAYRNLFAREPDEHGLAYYVGRLSLGYRKESIISQMAKSPGFINYDKIKDLKTLIRNQNREQHWFWGVFARYSRANMITQNNLNELARIRQNLNTIQDAISEQSQQTNIFIQQVISLSQTNQMINQRIVELTQQLPMTSGQSCQSDETPRLREEVVCQCFVDVLGREPESEETIKHYTRLATREELLENLMHSEEFQHKLLVLPEYARDIFLRQINHAF